MDKELIDNLATILNCNDWTDFNCVDKDKIEKKFKAILKENGYSLSDDYGWVK